MKVLIACEFSGIVREAFAAKGHDAWSCDILPTESPGNHIQGDVLEVINDGWDLMIGHPPCTYLSYAAKRVWNEPGRSKKRLEAAEFFLKLYNACVPKIAIENPLGEMGRVFRQHDQIINPFDFGHRERKRTCLWLQGLPPLMSTGRTIPEAPDYITPNGRGVYWHHRGKRDGHSRSRTFPGIANAMADQWGEP